MTGIIQFWHGNALQVASYAQAQPYDTETETRGDWPGFEVSQDHAVIAHLDVAAALAGQPATCELVYVDLPLAREHGGTVVLAAKEWGKRTDLFSTAMLENDTEENATCPENSRTTSPNSATTICDTPSPAPRTGSWSATDAASTTTTTLAVESSAGTAITPSPTTTDHTSADDTVTPSAVPADEETAPGSTAAPVEPSGAGGHPSPPGANLAPADQIARVTESPDEGGPADPEAFAILERRFNALPDDARAWIAGLSKQATQHRVSFVTSDQNGRKTVRRFEIIVGLIHLAESLKERA